MLESPGVGQEQTTTGWYDRLIERVEAAACAPRRTGSIHVWCSECGAVIGTNQTKCQDCHKKQQIATFNSFPVEKWDGETPVSIFDAGRYFLGDSILDYIADGARENDAELQICKCKPRYLSLVSASSWCDDHPQDGELPDAVKKAVFALNEAIKAAGPVSWHEDAVAIDVADLRERVNIRAKSHMSEHDWVVLPACQLNGALRTSKHNGCNNG